MNLRRLLLIPVAALIGGTAHGFQIEFTQTLCTAQVEPLSEEVAHFEQRLIKSKRLETRSSQHRRHVERHAAELLDALVSAQDKPSCDPQRRELISGWADRFEKLI